MSSYRYFRLRDGSRVWRSNSINYSIIEARFYTGTNQTGTEITGTAFASSYAAAGYEANKGNDGNNSTWWTADVANSYWGIDAGAGNSFELKSLSVSSYADVYGCSIPIHLIVEGSNDNSNWTLITPAGCPLQTTNTTTIGVVQNFNLPQLVSGGIGNQISGGQIG